MYDVWKMKGAEHFIASSESYKNVYEWVFIPHSHTCYMTAAIVWCNCSLHITVWSSPLLSVMEGVCKH